jgi:hemerythrin-like domain-containing protein
MLSCLEKIIEQATALGRLEEEPAEEAIDFFHSFAVRCHQRKEEAHLFPLLQARGFSGGCGPLFVMRREHELGRLHLAGTDRAIERASQGDANALQWFVQHGRSYTRLAREHIQNEELWLFPSANRALKKLDQQNLLATFEEVEAEEIRVEKLREPIKLRPGRHQLRVRHGDLRIEAREFDVSPRATQVLHVSFDRTKSLGVRRLSAEQWL